MKPFVKYLRSLGIRCVIYLDDLLVFCGNNFQEAKKLLRFVFSLLLALGITVNTTRRQPANGHYSPGSYSPMSRDTWLLIARDSPGHLTREEENDRRE
jgi:hypothetical protein